MISVLATLLFILAAYSAVAALWTSRGEAYRMAIEGRGVLQIPSLHELAAYARDLVEGLTGGILHIDARTLELIGFSRVQFLLYLSAMAGVVGLIGWDVSHWPGLAAGALLGAIAFLWRLRRMQVAVRRNAAEGLPLLVRFLHLLFRAGETVAGAIDEVPKLLPQSRLRAMWEEMNHSRQSGTPLQDALGALAERAENPDLAGVVYRLQHYANVGLPEDEEPFAQLASHMARLAVIEEFAEVERLDGPLNWTMIAAIFALLLVVVVPYVVTMAMQLFGG